jgi:hypothetical protein
MILIVLCLSMAIIEPAFGQTTVNVTATVPCFMNMTASYKILENCNANGDYLEFVTAPFEYITGGYLPMIIVSLIIGVVYMQYKEAIYGIFIGIVFLPISFMYFPDIFLSWAVIMAFVGIGILIWFTVVRQTQN